MIITLEQAKKHLNIGLDFIEDDEYLISLIEVAENLLEKDIHKKLSDVANEDGSIPAILKHACKILISNFYENRESEVIGVSVNSLPISYKYLMSKYKTYQIA